MAPLVLLETVLQHLEDGVVAVDAEGRRVYANDEAVRLLGEAPPPGPGQARLGDRVVEVRTATVEAHTVTFLRDVTSQVTAADAADALYRAAQQTTALLDALYGSAPVGLGFWDRDLRYVRVNEALAAINERSAEDHVGRRLAEVVPQLADVLEPLARGVMDTGEAVIGLEMTSGTPRDPEARRSWRTSYYPVLGPGGETIGVGAVVEETTARRRAEQRTELQHAVTRALSEADTVGDALARVLETIGVTLGWDVACYWSTDPDAPRVTWTRPGFHAEGFIAVTERASLTPAMLPGRVAASGAVERLTDLDPEWFARAPVAQAEGLRCGVAFPVLVGGATVGVVEAFSSSRRAADDDDLVASLEAIGGQLGQFLHRKRAEDERAQLLQRERAARADAEAAAATLRKLERVAQATLAHLSLQDLLDALLERIIEVLDADTAAILLLEDDDALHVRATVGFDDEVDQAVAVPLGTGMAGGVAARRTPLLAPDLAQVELVSPVLRERGINSLVAIPLVVEDRVIGVVHAGSEAYAQFVEDDVRLLELIADRIALAINQAALHEAERAAQERLQFLSEASARLASSLDVDQTLRHVARLAVPQFADWCAVDLVGSDGVLERVAIAHVDPDRIELARRLATAFPASIHDARGIGAVVRSGAPLVANAIGAEALRAAYGDRPAYLHALLRLELSATMIVPLVVRDRILGALTLVWAESGRSYGELDLAFAQELASRAAVAVDNAQLYRAAKRRRDQLAFLAEASELLGSTLEVDRTLEQVAQLLAERFADRTAVHLVGDDGRIRAATIATRDAAKPPLDDEPPEAVGAAVATASTQRWEADDDALSGIVVPLVARDRVLGTLSLARSETPASFDDDDIEFAEDVARRAAVAIDNAELYHAAALGRDRLGFLAEASALLGASLDVGKTLEQLAGLVEGRIAAECRIHLIAEAEAPADPAARRVVETGEPELADDALVVPLTARGRTFGALSLVWHDGGRRLGETDVEFARDLARRAAVAIDNAQLYGAAAERAQAARVLAAVGDGVFLVDDGGYVRTWNRAAAIATSLPASAVVDRVAVEAIPGWAAIAPRVAVTRAGSPPARPESLPLDLGTRELWLSISGVAVPDGVVYAFRDLTDERALEQMRTEFVSTVSHELRTPLAAIYGSAMTLRRSDVALDEAQRARLLDVVSGEADRLARTVNDILWASRLDTDSLHVAIQSCDPVALVDEVVKAQETHLDRAHELVVDAAPGLPHVAGDPDKVGRVLINLVDNAVKYSPDGGRVTVSVQPVGSHVRFSVVDEGLGIPVGEQRRVFEKFYRLDPNMNRGVGGTGLGLYICRELVRRMDGRVWVESAGPGRGSTFHVELPAASY